jgi:hypothetical protein
MTQMTQMGTDSEPGFYPRSSAFICGWKQALLALGPRAFRLPRPGTKEREARVHSERVSL